MRSNKKLQSKSRKRRYSNKKSRKRRYSKKKVQSKSQKRRYSKKKSQKKRYSKKKSQKRRYSKKKLQSKSRKRTLSASPMDGGGVGWGDVGSEDHSQEEEGSLDRMLGMVAAEARTAAQLASIKEKDDEMEAARLAQEAEQQAERELIELLWGKPLLARRHWATDEHAARGAKDWNERQGIFEGWMVPDRTLVLQRGPDVDNNSDQLSLENADALAAKVAEKKRLRAEKAEAEKAEAELMAAAVNADREWDAPTVAQLSKMLRRGTPPMSAAAVKAQMAAAHAEDALARLKSSQFPFLHPVYTQERRR